MKINSDILGNLALARLYSLLDGSLSNAYGAQIEPDDVDEAALMIEIKRALCQKKKRITLDITYSKTGEQ